MVGILVPLPCPRNPAGRGLISPEISTLVPANGESWLSIASRRYARPDALAVAGEPPVPAGVTF